MSHMMVPSTSCWREIISALKRVWRPDQTLSGRWSKGAGIPVKPISVIGGDHAANLMGDRSLTGRWSKGAGIPVKPISVIGGDHAANLMGDRSLILSHRSGLKPSGRGAPQE